MFNLLAATQPMSHDDILLFLAQIALLLGVARLLGELMRKFDQPAVIGELLAGLLVGPSVLGHFAPAAYNAVFPENQHLDDLLSAFSLIGVLMLLIVTGLEIDMGLIVRRARTALCVSAGGLILPFSIGLAAGFMVPESLLVKPEHRLVFSLFLAVAMSISAIPVIAKVLMDLGAIRRDIGQIVMAAAMLDDAVGWVLLSVAAGLASRGHVTMGDATYSLVTSALVMGLGLSVGKTLVNRILDWVEQRFSGQAPQLSAIIFLALAFAILTHGLELESMLGAFLAGILVGQSPRLRSQVAHTLELFTASFFAPIFFASAGLKVNLAALLSPFNFGLCLTILLIASVGKYLGCYVGGWVGGLGHWERIALGSGMNPRGAMGVIVARIGLSLGVLTPNMYTQLISMAILTSIAAPPLLRWSLAKIPVTPEEASRLSKEANQSNRFLDSLRKVLLPSRGGQNVEWAAHLLGHLSHHHPVAITTLFALPAGQKAPEGAEEAISQQLERSQGSAPTVKRRAAERAVPAILEEAERGYDLIVLGATVSREGGTFNRLIDEILGSSPCAAMVVRAHPNFDVANHQVTVRNVLLPVVGTSYSLRAAEVAAVICRSLQANLTVIHVVPEADGELVGPRSQELSRAFANQILDNHADVARGLGALVSTEVLEHSSPERAIVKYAEEHAIDLIFMGISFRPVGGQAFLGHRAERILQSAPCAAVVLCSGISTDH